MKMTMKGFIATSLTLRTCLKFVEYDLDLGFTVVESSTILVHISALLVFP